LRMSLRPGEEKPAIFTDPTYIKSTHWNLSTSQLSSEYFDGYGWGEVVPDGYGIAYQINANVISFNVVSMHLNNQRMCHYLREAADEMKELFEHTQAKEGRVPAKL
ncbi:4143_t:CDS:1, partial [Cetraspora pellucida]